MKLIGKKRLAVAALIMGAIAFALAGCASSQSSSADSVAESPASSSASVDSDSTSDASASAEDTASSSVPSTRSRHSQASTMEVRVNGKTFTATFSDTKAADEFRSLLPLTVDATELNGNEKYAELEQSLSTDGEKVVSHIEAGDIFLYGGNDVVLFYETHANSSWSYVPIAHIDDADDLADAVGSGDVTITYKEG